MITTVSFLSFGIAYEHTLDGFSGYFIFYKRNDMHKAHTRKGLWQKRVEWSVRKHNLERDPMIED